MSPAETSALTPAQLEAVDYVVAKDLDEEVEFYARRERPNDPTNPTNAANRQAREERDTVRRHLRSMEELLK